jgi:hypothetical protein
MMCDVCGKFRYKHDNEVNANHAFTNVLTRIERHIEYNNRLTSALLKRINSLSDSNSNRNNDSRVNTPKHYKFPAKPIRKDG